MNTIDGETIWIEKSDLVNNLFELQSFFKNWGILSHGSNWIYQVGLIAASFIVS